MGYKNAQKRELMSSKTGEAIQKKKKETEAERLAREEKEDEEWEKQCENYCARAITFAMMISPIWALLSYVGEWATRVPMVVDDVDMTGQRAIITGACDGMGAELAGMMVTAGASVVLACRDSERGAETVRQLQLGLEESQLARVEQMELDLASLASVRSFAQQYVTDIGHDEGLHVLVNNGGTANACNTTVDGYELAFQTNYLGHFLLTELLLPTLKASAPSRVVHVSCSAANDAKLDISNLHGRGPEAEGEQEEEEDFFAEDDGAEEGGGDQAAEEQGEQEQEEEAEPAPSHCSQREQYGMSKLAQIVHSNELERRLRGGTKLGSGGGRKSNVVSHVIDPGEVSSEFLGKAPSMVVSARQSMRTKMFMYFPPFRMMAWLMSGLREKIMGAMMRSVSRGATAQFHVASNPALGRVGGQLFSDRVGLFTNCGLPAEECGRVVRQPSIATDSTMRKALWAKSRELVAGFNAPLQKAD